MASVVRVGGLSAILVLLIACPQPAGAQDVPTLAKWTLELDVAPAPDPIAPMTERAQATVTATVTCEAQSVWTQLEPFTVEFSMTSDRDDVATYVFVPGVHYVTVDTQQCLDGYTEAIPVTVDLAFHPDVLDGDIVTYTFTALAPDLDLEAAVAWTQTAGFYFNHQARFEKSIWKVAPGGTIDVPGTFMNRGNGAVEVRFAISEDSSTYVAIGVPTALEVEAFSEARFDVAVNVPDSGDYQNRRDKVILDLEVSRAGSPTDIGDPVQLSAVVQTQGGGIAEELAMGWASFWVVLPAALFVARRRPSTP